MRMDLTAKSSDKAFSTFNPASLSILLKPACGLPGEYSYATDSHTLLRMLKQQTELPSSVLDRFSTELRHLSSARLRAVELDDRTLRNVGYFVD